MKRIRKNHTSGAEDVAFKVILYPNKEQKELIARTFGCCRYVYNRALNERKEKYKESKQSISYREQQNELPLLKKAEETKWLSEVDSTALQNTLRDLQDAYDHFYEGIKDGRYVGFPKFKSKHDYKESYRSTNNNNSIRLIDTSHIQLPKLGIIKCKTSREMSGRILNATVTMDADGHYEVSLMQEVVIEKDTKKSGTAIGIDLGLKSLAITSEGITYDNPKTYKNNLKKLRRLQRNLSRKSKDSKNREKARKEVAKLHRRIRNQRVDAVHKMTRQLVDSYDVICMEHLHLTSMKKNKQLSRSISDASWGEIRRQLEYKCKWAGRTLVLVDPYFPSSQLCSECGYKNTDVKNLSVRYWKCPVCGKEHDRDENAAINILNEGLKQLA